MNDTPDEPDLPANLRFLRVLVTVLTAVMIIGLVVVVALIVMRLSDDTPVLPEEITLPEGQKALSFTSTGDWYAVVTTDNVLLVYDSMTGALLRRIPILEGTDP